MLGLFHLQNKLLKFKSKVHSFLLLVVHSGNSDLRTLSTVCIIQIGDNLFRIYMEILPCLSSKCGSTSADQFGHPFGRG